MAIVGSTLAALGRGSADGDLGLCRIGTWPDLHEEEFVWNPSISTGTWVGTREYLMICQADTWALDLSGYALSAIQNNWRRFRDSIMYGKPHTHLTATFVAGTDTTMTVADTSSFPTSGILRVRNQKVTYTAKPSGTTFTVSTAGVSGTFASLNTPVVLTGPTTAAEVGGWGTSIVPMDRVGDLWSAGFRLQEKVSAWLNGGQDNTTMSVAAFYWNYNLTEDFVSPPLDPTGSGLGQGTALTSTGDPRAANRSVERHFGMT